MRLNFRRQTFRLSETDLFCEQCVSVVGPAGAAAPAAPKPAAAEAKAPPPVAGTPPPAVAPPPPPVAPVLPDVAPVSPSAAPVPLPTAPPKTPPPPKKTMPVAAIKHAQAIEAASVKLPPADPVSEITGTRTEYKVKMNRMRQKIAQRLKEAQNVNAMLTTFNEIDMR